MDALTGTAHWRVDAEFQKSYRARVAKLVAECWFAARQNELGRYLQPIPLTRLNAAQHAFRAVGAVRAANILRSGVYRLTHSTHPDRLSQVIGDLTTLLRATTEPVEERLQEFVAPRARGVRVSGTYDAAQGLLQPGAKRTGTPIRDMRRDDDEGNVWSRQFSASGD